MFHDSNQARDCGDALCCVVHLLCTPRIGVTIGMTKYHLLPEDRKNARRLTERIRQAADHLWELLLEAWETKAHIALGYKSWGEYISAEFDFSQRHAYRLVNQGSVIHQLREAVTHVSQPQTVTVTFREAEAISTRPRSGEGPPVVHPDVIQQVRAQVTAGVEAQEAVRVVIASHQPEPRSLRYVLASPEVAKRPRSDLRGRSLSVRDEQLLQEIHQRTNVLSPSRLAGLNERDRGDVLRLLDDIRRWAETAQAKVEVGETQPEEG